jgi:hypothetical protein
MGGTNNMKEKNFFVLEESPYYKGKYTININFDLFPKIETNGSFNLFAARLMGLSYPQYLRMCRDCFGATIIGKKSLYPVAYFNKTVMTSSLVRNLNTRMNLVMWEKEHPDWQKHQEQLAEKAAKETTNVYN